MKLSIRQARLDDVPVIVPFIQMAAGGISEFLLTDLIKDMSVAELLEMALTDAQTPYYYKNILVAESGQDIIAASNFYPAEEHALPDIMRSIIPQERLDVVQPYLQSRVENSMYIHTLAVRQTLRHSTAGFSLGKAIETIAKTRNKRCLSAHVWRDDTFVYHGLKLAGFKEIEHIPILPNQYIKRKNGMVLLKGPDF